MPFLKSFALEHEIVTFAWIDNAFVQFPLNSYATKGLPQRFSPLASSPLAWPRISERIADAPHLRKPADTPRRAND